MLTGFIFMIGWINESYAQTADITLSNAVTTSQTYTATHRITLNPGFSANGTNGTATFSIVTPSILNCVPLNATPSLNQNYVMTLTRENHS